MNINFERYYDEIGVKSIKYPKSFLKKWSKFNFEIAMKIFKNYETFQKHRIIKYVFDIPNKFHCWLCCGFRYIKDETVKGGKTWNDNYHMMSKLCRYKTWDDVKITQWDKIRFKLITGFRFEND